MTDIINLKYDGKLITQNKGMDVAEVADVLDGFSDFLRAISSAVQGGDNSPRVVVQGFKDGSLDIQFMLELVPTLASHIPHFISNSLTPHGALSNASGFCHSPSHQNAGPFGPALIQIP